jgi:pterin-4a-carbinolamine dehydratase
MRRRILLGYISLGMGGVKLIGDRFENSSAQDIKHEIRSLPQGWQVIKVGNVEKLQKQFLFSDFIQAFSFMTELAIALEKSEKSVNYSQTQYPEIFNVYNRVVVTLSNVQLSAKSSSKSIPVTLQTIKFAKSIDRLGSKNTEKIQKRDDNTPL